MSITLKEILEKCRKLRIDQERSITDEYAEVTFYSSDTDEWIKMFVDIVGPAIKPKGEKPTQEDLELTKEYGGICDNQTLFKKEYDDVNVIVMFWPWQNGATTTLKIMFLKK